MSSAERVRHANPQQRAPRLARVGPPLERPHNGPTWKAQLSASRLQDQPIAGRRTAQYPVNQTPRAPRETPRANRPEQDQPPPRSQHRPKWHPVQRPVFRRLAPQANQSLTDHHSLRVHQTVAPLTMRVVRSTPVLVGAVRPAADAVSRASLGIYPTHFSTRLDSL